VSIARSDIGLHSQVSFRNKRAAAALALEVTAAKLEVLSGARAPLLQLRVLSTSAIGNLFEGCERWMATSGPKSACPRSSTTRIGFPRSGTAAVSSRNCRGPPGCCTRLSRQDWSVGPAADRLACARMSVADNARYPVETTVYFIFVGDRAGFDKGVPRVPRFGSRCTYGTYGSIGAWSGSRPRPPPGTTLKATPFAWPSSSLPSGCRNFADPKVVL